MDNPLFLRSDAPVTAPVATLAEFLERSNATAVRLEPADDARSLLPHLERLAAILRNFVKKTVDHRPARHVFSP